MFCSKKLLESNAETLEVNAVGWVSSQSTYQWRELEQF